MKIWGITDIGLVRKENQDAYGVIERTESGHTVCVVCDGMGGAAAGNIASRIAVDTFLREVETALSAESTPEQARDISCSAASLANQAIRDYAQEHQECLGMGTTLVSAVVRDGCAAIANVGDSRAYHITTDDIVRVTKDHSLVESMLDRGEITAEEARRHPNRNVITRALGPDAEAACDGYITSLKPGEVILLCTDGLVDTVMDQEILFEVIHGESLDTCPQRLLSIAKAHGAPDNVTAVLLLEEEGGA